MKKLSKITEGLVGQPMFHLLSKVKEMERGGHEIIHFEIGDPSFNTPPGVIQAAKDSLDRGETHYADSMGLWELRQEICKYTKVKLNYEPKIDQVLIIQANAVIDFVVRCVADPGDEIIYPDPGFPTYFAVINYAGMKPVPVPLKEEHGFKMMPEDIERRITKRTRLIIINSPNNPTGSMMTQEDMKAVFCIARNHDVYLLSDEVYSEVVYDKDHFSPSLFDFCRERVITLNSFSKIYSMSGWRLGYAIGPQKVIKKMGLLLQTIVSCLPPFIQRGGIAAFHSPSSLIKSRNEELRLRRDYLVKALNTLPGFSSLVPDGAFYLFANVKNSGHTSSALTKILLEKSRVAILDGSCFGQYGKGYVRLCYASSPLEIIKRAVKQIRDVLMSDKMHMRRRR